MQKRLGMSEKVGKADLLLEVHASSITGAIVRQLVW